MENNFSHYFIVKEGKPDGPYELEQIGQKIKERVINRESYVWKNGMRKWIKAGNLYELTLIFDNY